MIENKETINYLNKFINYSKIHYPLNSESNYNEVIKALYNIEIFEHPDAYAYSNNIIYIFEHFRIDASHHNKKGSLEYKNALLDEQKFKEFCNSKSKKQPIYSGIIKNSANPNDYIKNVIKNFMKHYNQIDNYKRELINSLNIKNNVCFKTIFIIEDVSIFGNYFYDDKLHVVLPIFCKEFIDEIKSLKNIDYFICSSKTFENDNLNWLMSRKDLTENNVNSFYLKDKHMFSFDNIISLGFDILLK